MKLFMQRFPILLPKKEVKKNPIENIGSFICLLIQYLRIKLEREMGYLGKIEDARTLFKKLYNLPSNPDSVESNGD